MACLQVQMAPDCVGAEVQAMVDQLQSGQVQISNMATSAQLAGPKPAYQQN